MEETTMYQQTAEAQQAPVTPAETPVAKKDDGGKVGFWTYFGLIALFSVPIIGWIAGIVFMFAPKRKSLKNFARAMMAWVLVSVIFFASIFLIVQAVVTTVLSNELGLEFKSFSQMVEVIDEVKNGNYLAVLPHLGDEYIDEIVDAVDEEYEDVVRELFSGEYNGLLEDIQDRDFEDIAEDFDDGKYDDLLDLLDRDTRKSVKEELKNLENGDTPEWLEELEGEIESAIGQFLS